MSHTWVVTTYKIFLASMNKAYTKKKKKLEPADWIQYNEASQEKSLVEWGIVNTQLSQRAETRVLSTCRVSLSLLMTISYHFPLMLHTPHVSQLFSPARSTLLLDSLICISPWINLWELCEKLEQAGRTWQWESTMAWTPVNQSFFGSPPGPALALNLGWAPTCFPTSICRRRSGESVLGISFQHLRASAFWVSHWESQGGKKNPAT